MEARDFLLLADRLAGEDTAAGNRTALSRAYYAAFNASVEFLRGFGVRARSGHLGHEDVQSALRHSGVDAVIRAGAELRQLQSTRVRADYLLRDPFPENPRVVAEWLERVKVLFDRLDATAADEQARERIARFLSVWEQARRSDA